MAPQVLVVIAALVLCLVFSALLIQAIRLQRKAAKDLAWFYQGGSFELPLSMRGRS